MEKQLFIKKLKPIFFVILIAVIAYLAIKNTIKDNHYAEDLRKEYPFINEKDTLNEKVKTYVSNRGVLLITLANNSKFAIHQSRNYSYTPPFIDDFIKIEDSIVKKANSDTLYIYRDNQEYYFVIGKFIGKKSSSRLIKFNKE